MTDTKTLEFCAHHTADSVVAIWHGQPVTYHQFLAHVHMVAAELPDSSFAVNLCEDRYLFLVCFAAVIKRGQTNLLPASRLESVVEETINDYQNAYVISETRTSASVYQIRPEKLVDCQITEADVLSIDAEHIAAVVFTSGSTGKPKPNIKTWRSLYAGARLAMQRFEFRQHQVRAIIATVPPQHMYGLETSIVIPLLAGIATVCAATFYPADIQAAVKTVHDRCVLVSTPFHLKACVNAGLDWPDIEYTISATAQMPSDLAEMIERKLNTQLIEIFGASEFGSIATRKTTAENAWHLYDGMQIRLQEKQNYITGPQFKNPLPMHDQITLQDEQHFVLIGRNTDLIKIAGKRISLGELNQKLASIDGVLDGVFFIPVDDEKDVNQRLTAFVVAPGITKDHILTELKKLLDPVFLPRPLLLVDELPRNATGKLPQVELEQLYQSCMR